VALSTSATLTPGFRRNRMALGSLRPLAVETTLTAPDWVLPPTVIEDLVRVRERVGSVDACAEEATIRAPAEANKLVAARRAAMSAPLSASRRERYGIRLSLSVGRQNYLERLS
jgi:hypothetical protein